MLHLVSESARPVQLPPSIQQIRQSYLKPKLPDQVWPARPAARHLRELPVLCPSLCHPGSGNHLLSRVEVLPPHSHPAGGSQGARYPSSSLSPAGDAQGPGCTALIRTRLSLLHSHFPLILLLGHSPVDPAWKMGKVPEDGRTQRSHSHPGAKKAVVLWWVLMHRLWETSFGKEEASTQRVRGW